MKKFKFLPSVLMLVACVAVLCVGVFSLTPTENTIGGTINISSMARVKLTCYVDEEVVYDSQNTAYGVDWDLTETALNFDVSNYADASQVPLRTIRIHIQNLTGLHLGVYFYNGNETTLQTINGEKYATYDSLQLSDAVYKANAEEIDANKLVDITLSPYGYIAPANGNNTYDEYDMFINFDVVNLDITEVSKVISYMLRIEEYQSNVTINGSNVATFTPLANKAKQLVKLPTTNTNTAVPTIADASYGNVVIPTTYTSIPARGFTTCAGLTAVSIPQSISSVGNNAFAGSSALRLVDWHPNYTGSFPDGFSNIYTFPHGLTSMNFGASAKRVPANIMCIYSEDYDNNGLIVGKNISQLKFVHISNGVTSIGDSAFAFCENLEYVYLPKSIGVIGGSAFAFCENLVGVGYVGGTVSPGAFDGCTRLKWVTFSEKDTMLDECAFSGCSGLVSIVIPSTVTYMGPALFAACSGLRKIYIPKTVVTIVADMEYCFFMDCDSSLEIYTDVASAEEITAMWSEGWNYNGSTYLTVHYGESVPTNW